MRKTFVIVSFVVGLAMPQLASAMPIASGDTVAKASAQSALTLVRGGCGYRYHRGPYGRCYHN